MSSSAEEARGTAGNLAPSTITFQEFYCMLGPWARGRQKEVLAALKRLVNGYSVSPAKLIMDDDDEESVDMDELVFRPNPEGGLELSNSDDEE